MNAPNIETAQIERGKELDFIFAGKARFTALNTLTGTRITFKVAKAKPKPGKSQECHYVSLRFNEDETDGSAWLYIGCTFNQVQFWQSPAVIARLERTYTGAELQSMRDVVQKATKAFSWLFAKLKANSLPEAVQIWHCGACGRCGRALEVPLSILTGIGPECAKVFGIDRLSRVDALALAALEQKRAAMARQSEK